MRTRFAGSSDVGLLRDRNEDSFIVYPEYRFAAVADGMGGHLSGDVASSLAINTLRDFYSHTVGPDRTWPFPYDNELTEEENCVVVGVRLANQQVFGRARSTDQESGMGTTVVMVMFTSDEKQVSVGHVGDSRCYRIRGGQITQLTSDHSLVSEVTEIAPWLSVEEVAQLPSNVITRALGMAPDVVVDLLTTDTRPGDRYLLCSDGLNGMLADEEILSLVDGDDDLDGICAALIRQANAAGGNDNTTVVMVEVAADEQGAPSSLRAGGAVEVMSAELLRPIDLTSDDTLEMRIPVGQADWQEGDEEVPTPTANEIAAQVPPEIYDEPTLDGLGLSRTDELGEEDTGEMTAPTEEELAAAEAAEEAARADIEQADTDAPAIADDETEDAESDDDESSP